MNTGQYRIHIFQRGAPVTLTIIAINCAIYILGLALTPAQAYGVIHVFGLSAEGIADGHYWQLFTYEFIHGGFWHLLINMVGLWFVGREVEVLLGGGKYLLLYFVAGISGGLAQIFIPGAHSNIELIGASGCVFGVMIAFTTLCPNVLVTALIFFVLPLRMKAKFLGWGIFVLSILFWLSGLEPNIGHLAHLGGCVVGLGFGLLWKKNLPPLPFAGASPPPRRQPMRPLAPPSVPATEIQKILNKIVKEGFDSLNAEERHLLETQRSQLSRRGDIPKSELDP